MEPPLNEALESTADPLADLPKYIHPFRKELNGLQNFIENFQQRKAEMEGHHCPLSELKDFVRSNIVGIQQQIMNLIHMMSPFPFMRLPLEIRLEIYSYILPKVVKGPGRFLHGRFSYEAPAYLRKLAKDAVALLAVKQIHDEAWDLLSLKEKAMLNGAIAHFPYIMPNPSHEEKIKRLEHLINSSMLPKSTARIVSTRSGLLPLKAEFILASNLYQNTNSRGIGLGWLLALPEFVGCFCFLPNKGHAIDMDPEVVIARLDRKNSFTEDYCGVLFTTIGTDDPGTPYRAI
ncbi:hypothetical protein HYFRA_00010797 [Hymenoscyphus fraxineus]|uniref:Uncharacterized protein n=1 Tax=Hymenoscyphus fraxineus TaxID=746836 RepID=A0A9N9L0A1_9HELO|nr:hypothetical protein HYFRA_00010797 [Hymenoscyphus fraxineus]